MLLLAALLVAALLICTRNEPGSPCQGRACKHASAAASSSQHPGAPAAAAAAAAVATCLADALDAARRLLRQVKVHKQVLRQGTSCSIQSKLDEEQAFFLLCQ